jgi:hypothetical protein
VNIWQRFQMPAHGRKGPQQILPWRPTYGAPASSCDIVRRSVSSTEVSVSAGGTRSLFFARHAGHAASLILVAIAPQQLRPHLAQRGMSRAESATPGKPARSTPQTEVARLKRAFYRKLVANLYDCFFIAGRCALPWAGIWKRCQMFTANCSGGRDRNAARPPR